jgi:UDP-N-acetylglucosamine diphosphorylase / glucose-1-phosphate thymidylyltransferase / UDP-N-acetylgalactosamine diphosphorylase / glucosamine-1-phosphate N-acetyltransferase / galactosamine-1-phosphate N-acetyltransferase
MTAPRRIPVVLIESPQPMLAPLADLRPQCCIRTGALTLLERVRAMSKGSPAGLAFDVVAIVTHASRAVLSQEACHLPTNEQLPEDAICLFSHCVLPPEGWLSLEMGEAIEHDGQLLVARTNPTRLLDAINVPSGAESAELATDLSAHTLSLQVRAAVGPRVLTRPWSVRAHRDAALAHDIALLTASNAEGSLPRFASHAASSQPTIAVLRDAATSHDVYVHPWATVHPATIFDVTHGSICILDHAVIRPGAILIGPCVVGHASTVLERATIRGGTAIGPSCKVNGEVGGTIFQGFANKAHDGYVGDSWVGEWCNLGAGTTTSNLLNTYGETIAKALPNTRNERTGEVFLGTIFGDHTKTAICTRIMTASVLHTGSMFATTAAVSGTVPAFTWATDAGQATFRIDKFLDVMRTAMSRRKVTPSEAYVQAVHAAHGRRA